MIKDFQDLIPFTVDDENHIFISAKNLHQYLGIKTSFRVWFARMTDYGFEENTDYKKVYKNGYTVGGNQMEVDFMMKIDMAKEISMIQRSDKGKAVRKYFISVEERLKIAQMAIKNILNMNNQDFTYSQYSSENNTIYANETLSIANNVTTNFRDTAKILGVRENLLVNWLLLNNYCYRDKKGIIKPYAKYMEFFQMRDFTTESGHSGTQTLINSKGREEFRSMLMDENVIENNEIKLLE